MADNIVFDKAKFHFESAESEGLPLEQAYVHTGMYFAGYEALVTGVGGNILSGRETWGNYDRL